MTDIRTYKMLIDGAWVEAADGAVFDSINPTTGQVWSKIPEATAEDVDRAVRAAHDAFLTGPWSKMTPTERGKCLRKLAELLADQSEGLGRTESIDTGKMLKETRWQAKYIAEFFQFYAGCADKISGETLPIDKPDAQQEIPRSTYLYAPRARDISGHDAADSGRAFGAQKGAVIHRFKRKTLPFFGQQGLDLGNRCASFDHQRQRAGFI